MKTTITDHDVLNLHLINPKFDSKLQFLDFAQLTVYWDLKLYTGQDCAEIEIIINSCSFMTEFEAGEYNPDPQKDSRHNETIEFEIDKKQYQVLISTDDPLDVEDIRPKAFYIDFATKELQINF